MRNLLVAILGFAVGAAVVVGVAVAVPKTTTVSMQMSSGSGMPMNGSSMMGSQTTAPTSRTLTIRHVQRGCHVWSNGKPTMSVTLRRNGRLAVVNQDIDAHRLIQLSGPARLRVQGATMMMNHRSVVAFTKKGVYRLKTKTVEMPGGMEIEVKTIGPDNVLRLTVTVK